MFCDAHAMIGVRSRTIEVSHLSPFLSFVSGLTADGYKNWLPRS